MDIANCSSVPAATWYQPGTLTWMLYRSDTDHPCTVVAARIFTNGPEPWARVTDAAKWIKVHDETCMLPFSVQKPDVWQAAVPVGGTQLIDADVINKIPHSLRASIPPEEIITRHASTKPDGTCAEHEGLTTCFALGDSVWICAQKSAATLPQVVMGRIFTTSNVFWTRVPQWKLWFHVTDAASFRIITHNPPPRWTHVPLTDAIDRPPSNVLQQMPPYLLEQVPAEEGGRLCGAGPMVPRAALVTPGPQNAQQTNTDAATCATPANHAPHPPPPPPRINQEDLQASHNATTPSADLFANAAASSAPPQTDRRTFPPNRNPSH